MKHRAICQQRLLGRWRPEGSIASFGLTGGPKAGHQFRLGHGTGVEPTGAAVSSVELWMSN